MAYAEVIDVTRNSVTIKIKDLSSPARDYDNFRIYVGSARESWSSSNSGYTTQGTVYGLNSGTRYYWTAEAKFKGTWYDVDSGYVTTESDPVEISSIDVSYGTTSVNVSGYVYNASNVRVYLCLYGNSYNDYEDYSYISVGGSGSFSTSFRCNPNTKYKVFIRAFGEDGSTDYADYVFTSDSYGKVEKPYVSIIPSITSCTFTWNHKTGATRINIKVYNSYGYNQTFTVASTNESLTISNLSTDTSYHVEAYFDPYTGYETSDTFYTNFKTIQKPTFYWTIPPQQNEVFSITYSDWNKMCGVINSWRTIKNQSTYSFPVVNRGDPIYARDFNKVLQILRQLGCSNVPNDVEPNSPCYASLFRALESCINNLKA